MEGLAAVALGGGLAGIDDLALGALQPHHQPVLARRGEDGIKEGGEIAIALDIILEHEGGGDVLIDDPPINLLVAEITADLGRIHFGAVDRQGLAPIIQGALGVGQFEPVHRFDEFCGQTTLGQQDLHVAQAVGATL
jgi:hypothetical protein